MSVSWIDGIYNNSSLDMHMWCEDTRHLGVVHDAATGKEVGRCDNGRVVTLRAGGHFRADWCGIPWYSNERHYRALSSAANRDYRVALLLWQSIVQNKDGIVFLNGSSMTRIGGYEFGKACTRHYALMIEPAKGADSLGAVQIRLELRNTDDTGERIVNLLGKVVGDLYDDARTVMVEAGKAALGKTAGQAAPDNRSGIAHHQASHRLRRR